MIFDEKIITLKNGKKCILRSVDVNDAENMIDYMRIVSSETPFLLRYGNEVNFTIESEAALLESKRENPQEIMMVAEVDGMIAGNCGISSIGNMRRVAHRCGFAIALKKAYWNLGIGTQMMEYVFSLAKKMGYEQIELGVVDGNSRAKQLYEKLGFVETGKNKNALKYDDGTYRDEYAMVKMLKE